MYIINKKKTGATRARVSMRQLSFLLIIEGRDLSRPSIIPIRNSMAVGYFCNENCLEMHLARARARSIYLARLDVFRLLVVAGTSDLSRAAHRVKIFPRERGTSPLTTIDHAATDRPRVAAL